MEREWGNGREVGHRKSIASDVTQQQAALHACILPKCSTSQVEPANFSPAAKLTISGHFSVGARAEGRGGRGRGRISRGLPPACNSRRFIEVINKEAEACLAKRVPYITSAYHVEPLINPPLTLALLKSAFGLRRARSHDTSSKV